MRLLSQSINQLRVTIVFPTLLLIALLEVAKFDYSNRAVLTSLKAESTNKDDSTRTEDLHAFGKNCHFGDAKGHFENGWNWVADGNNHSSDEDCSFVDRVSPLFANSTLPTKSTTMSFIFIGDSLDGLIVNHLCENGQALRHIPPRDEWPDDPSLVNHAKKNARICTNGNLTFSFFAIHGMHHPCSNPPYLKRVDTRHFNTTAERVEKLLPVDTLTRLPNATSYRFLVSSSLWDLSKGCNNQIGVSENYQKQYHEGILAIHRVLTDIVPTPSSIYWRTSPPVTAAYDKQSTKARMGRTRANQKVLNRILRDTVANHSLGVIIDWAKQLEVVNDTFLESHGVIRPRDGRHYRPEPGMAFFNMWLNVLSDEGKYGSTDISMSI